ncbi:Unknown protein sequence [Pseudomonas syringae pv. maculicola]|nr:Unknown protein sequence [Pseudomonas syringae pv. maculicola]
MTTVVMIRILISVTAIIERFPARTGGGGSQAFCAVAASVDQCL